MKSTESPFVQKVLLGSRIGYIEPAIRLIVGALILVITLGFVFVPTLNWLWLGISIFVVIGLLGSGLTQFCVMAWSLRRMGFRSEWDELKALERAHTEEKTRAGFLDTLNLLNEVIVEMTTDAELTWVSDKWSELFGAKETKNDASVPMNFRRCIDKEYLAKFDELVDFLRQNPEQNAKTSFLVCGEGKDARWVEGNFTIFRNINNQEVLRGILHDITESHEEQLAIAYKATHDELTGLPNRALLEDRMQQMKALSDRKGSKFALFFIDLDNFKQINDRLGHHVGDEVLKSVANALSSSLRPSDTIARWGGDEFVALVSDLRSPKDASRVAESLFEKTRQKMSGYPTEIITFSVGVAVFPDDSVNIGDLIVKADQALYSAKSQGRNNIQYAQKPEAA